MIDKICKILIDKMKKEMPEITDEKAEIINYGLLLLIGEIPKVFIIIGIAYMLKVLKLTIISIISIIPYRMVSGGTHLHTNIGCIIATSIFYIGNVFISKYLLWNTKHIKYFMVILIWLFSIIMIKKYAPADTQNVPILRTKERKTKKILSYIIMTVTLILGMIIKNDIVSNLLIIGILLQTITITKFMYKITKNKYGYLEYIKTKTY